MQTSSFRTLNAAAYAAERLLADAIHDEHVSVDAVVVLDALIDHLGAGGAAGLETVSAEAQLTCEQFRRALSSLDALGYLAELADHIPSVADLRAAALRTAA